MPLETRAIWRPSDGVKTRRDRSERRVLGQLDANRPLDTSGLPPKNALISHSQNIPIEKETSRVPLNRVVSFCGATSSSSAFPFPIYCDNKDEENQPSHFQRNAPGLASSKSTPNILSGDVCNLPIDVHRESQESQPHSMGQEETQQQPKGLPLGDLPLFRQVQRAEDEDMAKDSPMMLDVVDSGEKPMELTMVKMDSDDHQSTVDMLDMEEYKMEIYSYLTEAQERHMPKSNYMTKQPDITFPMRSILVDWLVEVSEEYKLHNETLYLAVNYVDRFLSFMSVQRAKLQLVGTACMFIASKYEEIYPPDIGEFVYITDDTYSKKQVLRMEQLVLKVLNFDLAVPTILLFVTKFSKALQSDEEALSLALYLSELSLLEAEKLLPFKYSVIAAASVALARHTLGQPAWPDAVAELSGLGVDDFKDCLIALHELFKNALQLPQQAIREKYKTSKYHNVASLTPTPIF